MSADLEVLPPPAAPPAPARPPRHAPDALDRLGERLGEKVNPIVVKEIRQGLRTRAFWIFFSLMLFACLVISLVAVATSESYAAEGKAYFVAYDVCLGLVLFFVIPYSAYRSMAKEREEETWVLLTLTGLGPRAILRGKMGSFMVQGGLYASAAAPFLLFSYYLNGIDLPTIVLAVAGAVAWQLFLTSVCVSIATLAESKVVRSVLHFVTLGILLQGLWAGLGTTFGLVESLRDMLGNDAAPVVAVSVLFGLSSWSVLLYEAAAARMSLLTESYARGPRLAMLGQLLGMVALFAWGVLASRERELPAVGAIVCSAQLLLVGLFVASDHDGMARSLWLKGPRVSLLKPGALRGFRLVLLCYALLAGVFTLLQLAVGGEVKHLAVVLAAPAYGALYLALPMILARLVRSSPAQRPALTRVLAVGLFVLGAGGPPLFSALFGGDADSPLLNLLNPVVGLINLGEEKSDALLQLAVLWGLTLAAVLLAHELARRLDNPPPLAEVKA
jgi:ABC-type transport system involved in multi-copper enzyme maturation permease subunit